MVKRSTPSSRRPKKQRKSRSLATATFRDLTPVSRGIPSLMRTILSYMDSKVLTASASAATSNIYRLNSVYDPDYSGAGSQPVGFDNMALLYGRFRVDRVWVEIEFLPGNATASLAVVGIRNDLTSVSTTDGLYALASSPGGTSRSLTGYAGYGNAAPIKACFDLAKLSGIGKPAYKADDRYQSVVTTNPSETQGLCIAVGAVGSAAASSIVAYTIRMRFDVSFFDRVTLPVS